MSNEIKLGDIVVFKTGNRAFEVIGKYILSDDRLWRVDAITENDPPTPDRNRKYRLVAVDCPNVMLDEIPEIYVESYSEKLERELEEQRKEALKMKRNEIKLGDKIRVSKDIPQFYLEYNSYRMFEIEHRVVDVNMEDGFALLDSIPPKFTTILPTKYLVKVDAEAKEAKFKVGDKVKVNLPRSIRHNTIGTVVFAYASCNAVNVDFGDDNEPIYCDCDCLELYTEPTEQAEAKTKPKGETLTFPICFDLLDELESCDSLVSIRERMRKALKEVEAHNKPRYVPKIMFNTEFWVKYEADLAKEVVLKAVNKFNDPKEAAEYAVSVAEAVVEGLKRE